MTTDGAGEWMDGWPDGLRDHEHRRGEEGRGGNREIGVWLKHRGRHAIILGLPLTMSAEIVVWHPSSLFSN